MREILQDDEAYDQDRVSMAVHLLKQPAVSKVLHRPDLRVATIRSVWTKAGDIR